MSQRSAVLFALVEDQLIRCGQFRLAGKKQLVRGFAEPQVVAMDVSATPPQRDPLRRQRCFYSGKKKRHTLKCQIVLEPDLVD